MYQLTPGRDVLLFVRNKKETNSKLQRQLYIWNTYISITTSSKLIFSETKLMQKILKIFSLSEVPEQNGDRSSGFRLTLTQVLVKRKLELMRVEKRGFEKRAISALLLLFTGN